MGELPQTLELNALERENRALCLGSTAAVVADHPVGANHAMARDEIGDGVVGEGCPDRTHGRRMSDLARDPSIWPDLAAPDLLRLHQDRLRERCQATQVELQAPLALELILDLRRQVLGGIDADELASNILAGPLLELRRRLAAHRGRNAEPAPCHVDMPQHRLENRI